MAAVLNPTGFWNKPHGVYYKKPPDFVNRTHTLQKERAMEAQIRVSAVPGPQTWSDA
jgi:hypothetical protein